MQLGRPTSYTPEIGEAICGKIAEGMSIRSICKEESMPCTATVFNWLRNHKDFLDQYTIAKEEQADALVEEMLDIADDGTNDWMERHDEDGGNIGWKVNGEHIQRSRLRIETRKWTASKMKPKKYGERITQEVQGGDKPVSHKVDINLTPEEAYRRMLDGN